MASAKVASPKALCKAGIGLRHATSLTAQSNCVRLAIVVNFQVVRVGMQALAEAMQPM